MLKFQQALAARRKAVMNGEEKDQGFTLIELLIVVLIIGVLAAIAIPVYLSTVKNTQKTAGQQQVSQMVTSIAAYSSANNGNLPADTTFGTDADLKKSLPDSGAKLKVSYLNDGNTHFCLVATYLGTESSTWYSFDGSSPAIVAAASAAATGAATEVPAGCTGMTGTLHPLNGAS